jgi:uncharacterized RmlC-like cupin family protein
VRLVATDEYDAWLLRWSPGSRVTPHDHGASMGAFSVISGELTELRWDNGLCRERLVIPGELVMVPQGVVHDVVALGPTPALSIHAYSPPLTTMGFYDGDGRRVGEEAVADDAAPPARSAPALHVVHGLRR